MVEDAVGPHRCRQLGYTRKTGAVEAEGAVGEWVVVRTRTNSRRVRALPLSQVQKELLVLEHRRQLCLHGGAGLLLPGAGGLDREL